MSYRRDHRSSKSALFDGLDNLEEGGLRASSSFSHDVKDHDNGKAIESLHDRVAFLKRVIYMMKWRVIIVCLTGWCVIAAVKPETSTFMKISGFLGNGMDASRGIMSGTMDRFKKVSKQVLRYYFNFMVFEKKSNRKMCTLVMAFVVSFLIIYYLFRMLRYVRG
ncbi:bet1-like SNARE 1-2 [Gossypium australe]|uniref:Bet1-like SNARE 1-2 n=1 Tax=Gossypium australe TaxID=47621 RepID=A0A5B6UBA4_9ROSI|nr:bet1-like SNARE 1-2 [Gossypium australe]